MSQFDNSGNNKTDLGNSPTTSSRAEDDVIDSPFSQNDKSDDFLQARHQTGEANPQGVSPRRSGPIMATQDSGNSLYDLGPQQSASQLMPESSTIPCVPIQTSAKDLGLDPNLLHVFVFSDAGKPIYSRYLNSVKCYFQTHISLF